MDFALQPHLYRHVPVLYWPWVFWQLWRIALWGELTGRDVLVTVDETGRVHIRHVSDDPSLWTPSLYPHLHEYYLSTRLPGERRDLWRWRIEAAYAPGFGVQAWIISPRVLGAVAFRFFTPTQLVIPDCVQTHIRDPVVCEPGSGFAKR